MHANGWVSETLAPLIAETAQAISSGMPAETAIQEAVAAAFLIGRGLAPEAAVAQVRQRRLAMAARVLPQPQTGPVATLGSRIKADMQDETTAAAFYGELLALVDDLTAASYLQHAMEDEQKHYRMLGDLYQRLTGQTYTAEPEKVEYSDLQDGLQKAMDAEYEAFEEYRRTYLAYPDEWIRQIYFELMTDELEHVTRFNYILQTL